MKRPLRLCRRLLAVLVLYWLGTLSAHATNEFRLKIQPATNAIRFTVEMSLEGPEVKPFVLQRSVDATNWLDYGLLYSQTNNSSPVWFLLSTNLIGVEPYGLFRAREFPPTADPPDFTPHSNLPPPPRPAPDGPQEPADDGEPAPAAYLFQNVWLNSGEFFLDYADLFVGGRAGMDFEFRRIYRSQLNYDSPLGHNWTFNYNESLFDEDNGDVTRMDPRGHVDRWFLQPDDSYLAPPGQFSTLRKNPDGTSTLREVDGFERWYRSDGRLFAYVDRHGNLMSFLYDEEGNLSTVIDVYGREHDFFFEIAPDAKKRLAWIRDFVGREVHFTYSSEGDLIEQRSPVVVGTSTGDDFPNGRTERYTYRTSTGNTNLDHNLQSVTRAQEVASNGPPQITVIYGENPTNAATLDRVLVEVVGGMNDSGIPAGGTNLFGYTPVNQGVSNNPALPRLKVSIFDPNGNEREVEINEDEHAITERKFTRGLRAGEPPFFEKRTEYNPDGKPIRRINPLGNEVRRTYGTGSRAAQKNWTEREHIPDSGRGGTNRYFKRSYEPLYQQKSTEDDPRENDTGFVPPIGTKTPGRYVKVYYHDYQEGSDPVPEAVSWGIDISGVARGMGDLNGDGRTDQTAGNCVREEGPTVTLEAGSNMAIQLGSTAQEIICERQWNDRGQLTAKIDPEGNKEIRAYHPENDPDGDGNDLLAAGNPTVDAGYLMTRTRDAETTPRRTSTRAPQPLVDTFTRNLWGRIIAWQNARGVRTDFEVNALDEVVVVTRGAATAEAIASGQLPTGEAPLSYQTEIDHDHNGRITAIRVEDDPAVSTTPGVGGWIDHNFVYDIDDNLVEESHEIDAVIAAVTRHRYDANGNRTAVHHPRANQAVSPVLDNVDTALYDERDLPMLVTEGAGGTNAGTSQFNYDDNGNLVESIDAEDNDGDLMGESTLFLYDGHDRLIKVTSPIGTQMIAEHDPANNVVRLQIFGHPGNQPTNAIVRLKEVRLVLDELDRVVRVDEDLFVVPGVTPQRTPVLIDGDSNGAVTVTHEFDALGNRRFVVEDDGDQTEQRFDGANRIAEVLRELGNRTEYFYDNNGNKLREVSVEHSPEGIVADQTYTDYHVYDQLDRKVRSSNEAGETQRRGYDSRNNVVSVSDANGQLQVGWDALGVYPGIINDPGNRQDYEYDGGDRRTAATTPLYLGGKPGPTPAIDSSNPFNPDGHIRIQFGWDVNGNMITFIDDNSNPTTYSYDSRDRNTGRTLADSTSYAYGYDRDNNRVSSSDPNGTTATYTYDADDRVTQVSVSRGAGVIGSTQQTFSYDGRGHVTRSTDDNGGNKLIDKLLAHDSLGRLLEEQQGTLQRPISYVYDGDSSVQSITYNHGKQYQYTYDKEDRVKTVSDGSPIVANIAYMGAGAPRPQTLLERKLALGRDHPKESQVAVNTPDSRQSSGRYASNSGSSHTSDDNGEENPWSNLFNYNSMGQIVLPDSAFESGAGRVLQLDLGNNTMELRHDGAGNDYYDESRRPVQIEVTDSLSLPIFDRAYMHGRSGNLLREQRGDDSNQIDIYEYDSANRLKSGLLDQFGDGGVSYRDGRFSLFDFDGVGNRRRVDKYTLSSPLETSLYNVNGVNEYTAIAAVIPAYDLNGNLTNNGTFTFEYDFQDRVVRVALVTGEEIAVYAYDALGRRVSRLVKNAAGTVLIDDENYHDLWGNNIGRYSFRFMEPSLNAVWVPGDTGGPVFYEVTITGYPFSTRNWLHWGVPGNLMGTSDAGGFQRNKYVFDPYLATYAQVVLDPNPPWLAGGDLFDNETAQHYDGSRHFDPDIGRFTTRSRGGFDPMNDGNQYSFQNNNPVGGGAIAGGVGTLGALGPAIGSTVGNHLGSAAAQTEPEIVPNEAKAAVAPGVVKFQAPGKAILTIGTESKPLDLWETMLMLWLGPGSSDAKTALIHLGKEDEDVWDRKERAARAKQSANMHEDDGESDILADMNSQVVMPKIR